MDEGAVHCSGCYSLRPSSFYVSRIASNLREVVGQLDQPQRLDASLEHQPAQDVGGALLQHRQQQGALRGDWERGEGRGGGGKGDVVHCQFMP